MLCDDLECFVFYKSCSRGQGSNTSFFPRAAALVSIYNKNNLCSLWVSTGLSDRRTVDFCGVPVELA